VYPCIKERKRKPPWQALQPNSRSVHEGLFYKCWLKKLWNTLQMRPEEQEQTSLDLRRIAIRKVCTEGFLQLISLLPSSKEPSSIQLSQTSKEWLANTNSIFLLICQCSATNLYKNISDHGHWKKNDASISQTFFFVPEKYIFWQFSVFTYSNCPSWKLIT
jgi:hypothetical protein